MTNAAPFALTHGAAILFMWNCPQAGADFRVRQCLLRSDRLQARRVRAGIFPDCNFYAVCWRWILVPSGRQGWPEGHRFADQTASGKLRTEAHAGPFSSSMLLANSLLARNFASLLAGKSRRVRSPGFSLTKHWLSDMVAVLTLRLDTFFGSVQESEETDFSGVWPRRCRPPRRRRCGNVGTRVWWRVSKRRRISCLGLSHG